jgi:glucuronate isomerase
MKFKVRAACATDDPCADASSHRALNASATEFRVYPRFVQTEG